MGRCQRASADFGRMLACSIGLPRFELGTSPTRTERATRLRHSPTDLGYPVLRSSLRRYGVVIADRQAREEGLEALLDGQAVLVGEGTEAGVLDRLALGDHLLHEIRMLVGEEGPHRVEAGLHQRLEERVAVDRGPFGLAAPGHPGAG